MFKNLTVYRIASGMPINVAALETALQRAPFFPLEGLSNKSVGWVPPRGHANGPLVESVNGQWLLRFMEEMRTVPRAAMCSWMDAACQRIEETTGRKPGKMEKKDLLRDAYNELMPRAFPRQVATWIWLDPEYKRLILDTTSKGMNDDILTALVKVLDGLSVEPLNTSTSPSVAMAAWLADQEGPHGFSIGKACELRSADESQAKVRYSNHPLMLEEVKAHIAQGKQPTCLALEWDDRVGFVLSDNLQLKKVAFADSVLEQSKAQGQRVDDFDGNVLMATAELGPLINDLVDALGGENDACTA